MGWRFNWLFDGMIGLFAFLFYVFCILKCNVCLFGILINNFVLACYCYHYFLLIIISLLIVCTFLGENLRVVRFMCALGAIASAIIYVKSSLSIVAWAHCIVECEFTLLFLNYCVLWICKFKYIYAYAF